MDKAGTPGERDIVPVRSFPDTDGRNLCVEHRSDHMEAQEHSVNPLDDGTPHDAQRCGQKQRRRHGSGIVYHIFFTSCCAEYFVQRQMFTVRVKQFPCRIIGPAKDSGIAGQEFLEQMDFFV